jgi:hypothetical protein
MKVYKEWNPGILLHSIWYIIFIWKLLTHRIWFASLKIVLLFTYVNVFLCILIIYCSVNLFLLHPGQTFQELFIGPRTYSLHPSIFSRVIIGQAFNLSVSASHIPHVKKENGIVEQIWLPLKSKLLLTSFIKLKTKSSHNTLKLT